MFWCLANFTCHCSLCQQRSPERSIITWVQLQLCALPALPAGHQAAQAWRQKSCSEAFSWGCHVFALEEDTVLCCFWTSAKVTLPVRVQPGATSGQAILSELARVWWADGVLVYEDSAVPCHWAVWANSLHWELWSPCRTVVYDWTESTSSLTWEKNRF